VSKAAWSSFSDSPSNAILRVAIAAGRFRTGGVGFVRHWIAEEWLLLLLLLLRGAVSSGRGGSGRALAAAHLRHGQGPAQPTEVSTLVSVWLQLRLPKHIGALQGGKDARTATPAATVAGNHRSWATLKQRQ